LTEPPAVCDNKGDDTEDDTEVRRMGRIATERVIERLDRYYAANDAAGAERHLLYWLAEAQAEGDARGMITVRNELMGLYRKNGDREKACACVDEALALVRREGLADTVSGGTVYVNCATVYTAFGRTEDALPLFERAAAIYEKELGAADARLGSLYNNMAAALADAGRYARAEEAYGKALTVMRSVAGAEPELAVTKLNLANLLEAAYGAEAACERIEECVRQAHDLLETEGLPRNGHYAFVCDKCAPVFEYYGWFLYARSLGERSAAIYAGEGQDEGT